MSVQSSGGSLSKTSSAAASTLPRNQGLEKRFFIHDAAAGGVDDDDAVFHLREFLRPRIGLGVLGTWSEMMSAWARSSSSVTWFTGSLVSILMTS